MSKQLTVEELETLISKAIDNLSNYLKELSCSDDSNRKRASLISYWTNDYVKYLKQERTYVPQNYKYKRGDIVLVNFGYRIGSELGGLHFAIVLDKYNSKKSPIMTVIPLSSFKNENNYNSIYSFVLQKGVYELYLEKREKLIASAQNMLKEIKMIQNELSRFTQDDYDNFKEEKYRIVNENFRKINDKIESIDVLDKSFSSLKRGTVVSVSQITTISKQRIINPKKIKDTLAGIKIDTQDLNELNNKLQNLFIF
ncbi:MAG: type II toxin-antitoxin system PemK/MazF family toxin [Eubacterium sp.]